MAARNEDGIVSPCIHLIFQFDSNQDWDQDGVLDMVDNCPLTENTPQANQDGDEHGDACDYCPYYAGANNYDYQGDGIGDACECGDQSGSGRVDVNDIVSISLAIFRPDWVTDLCDTNNDDKCDVRDMIGVNQKIFGRPAYCSRYPPPGP
jgi:hypothetical protein